MVILVLSIKEDSVPTLEPYPTSLVKSEKVSLSGQGHVSSSMCRQINQCDYRQEQMTNSRLLDWQVLIHGCKCNNSTSFFLKYLSFAACFALLPLCFALIGNCVILHLLMWQLARYVEVHCYPISSYSIIFQP